MQQPQQSDSASIPSELLEALAKDYDLDPVEIRFTSCATCPGG